MFSEIGIVFICIFFGVYVATLSFDYYRRHAGESLVEVLRHPGVITYLPLPALGTAVLVTTMESDIWKADSWKSVSPVPFYISLAMGMVIWVTSTIRDLSARDKTVDGIFNAWQNPSRLTIVGNVVVIASGFALWLVLN